MDLRMTRHFLKADQFGHSTNSWVDLDDFPTCWFTAAKTINFVSASLVYFPHLSLVTPHVFLTQHVSLSHCYAFCFWAAEVHGLNVFLHVSLPSWENVDHVDACA